MRSTTLGDRIYAARRKAGLTQEELAEILDVSRQAVSKWESGTSYPETHKFVAMCKLFHLSANDLLMGPDSDGYYATNKPPEVEAEKFEAKPYGEQKPGGEQKPYGEQKPDGEQKPRSWKFDNSEGHGHFEYVSKLRIGKLPLVHINIGLGAYRAKGVIAIGNAATGLISLGFLSVGILSFGFLSVGLFALGMLAFGLLMGAGGVATGLFAAGGVAIGILCFGGVAIGYIGVGGCAVGQYALGGYASGGYLAVGVTGAKGKFAFRMPADYAALYEFLKTNVGGWLSGFIEGIASSLG